MEQIRQYLLSVIVAAVICAFIMHLCGAMEKRKDAVKLVCGLFMALTVIRPVADIRLDALSSYTISLEEDAQAAIAKGTAYTRDSLGDIIKRETQAYILDKARSMGAQITVEVVLNQAEQPKPEEVYIHGSLSPLAKQQLQAILTDEIGIAKENQIWIR